MPWVLVLLGFAALASVSAKAASSSCRPSVTTVSGTHAPNTVCSGRLIFSDDFDYFNLQKWQHENTLGGGGNWEFQWYSNNRTNSYTRDGNLHIRPSLLSEHFNEDFLFSGTLDLAGGAPVDSCTNPSFFGCNRTGTATNILNPIKSARIRTVESFSFRYGRVEVRAKMPAGDWLWPAIWLMPTYNTYGGWPASGEIDLVESRGNRELFQNGIHIGSEEAASTLHFGPYTVVDGWRYAHWEQRNTTGYDNGFFRYQMEWTPDYLRFGIDDVVIGNIAPGEGGFWEIGEYTSLPNYTNNPWRYGTKMAPFDEQFHFIINLAVGGVNFFPDDTTNPAPKPWSNQSPTAATDFWQGRNDWLPTWDMTEGGNSSLQVDYVRVWAL